MGRQVYGLALGVGLGLGILYGILGVLSPPPSALALLGLIVMLAGAVLAGHLRGRLPTQAVVSNFLHSKTFATPSRAAREPETLQ